MLAHELLAKTVQGYDEAYRKRTPRSRAVLEKARKYLPGGDTRSAIWYQPYPIWIDKAGGFRFTDVDGHEYIDFHNCYTVMILGHGNPKVVASVREQAAKGTGLAALVPKVVDWAELLCSRVKSIERVKFGNSGSEGVMMAVRAARAFTGKDLLLKTEDGYHGSYDPVVYPSDSPGITRNTQRDSMVVPYNDKLAAEKAIVENRGRLAAVIVEGVMGSAGLIPPRDGYLAFLRRVTAENGVLLILDEVITLRLAVGGIQSIYGIEPDLTTLGKIIGGGYPVGAVGGREDIMRVFSPEAHQVHISGTLTANPITATAGLATLEQLTAEELDRINKLGESFAQGVRSVFQKHHIKGQVTGMGSLQNIHFSPQPVIDGKTATQANKDLLHLFHLAIMERGIFAPDRALYCISTPMGQKEVDTAVKAIDDAMGELKPLVEQIWPELAGEPVLAVDRQVDRASRGRVV